MIRGFKCFDKGLINRYGKQFVLNKTYSVEGVISFGNRGNGYHFCANPEDTLRYFLPDTGLVTKDDIDICRIESNTSDYVTYEDEYYGYYDMYAAREIILKSKMSHEELIEYMKDTAFFRKRRFVEQYYLLPEELELFLGDSLYLDQTIKEKIKMRQYG